MYFMESLSNRLIQWTREARAAFEDDRARMFAALSCYRLQARCLRDFQRHYAPSTASRLRCR